MQYETYFMVKSVGFVVTFSIFIGNSFLVDTRVSILLFIFFHVSFYFIIDELFPSLFFIRWYNVAQRFSEFIVFAKRHNKEEQKRENSLHLIANCHKFKRRCSKWDLKCSFQVFQLPFTFSYRTNTLVRSSFAFQYGKFNWIVQFQMIYHNVFVVLYAHIKYKLGENR